MILILLLAMAVLLPSLTLFNPLNSSQKVVDEYLKSELQGGITSRDLIKRIDNNPLHPKYIYVGNYGDLESSSQSFRVYYYFTLNRKGVFTWEINQDKSRHGISYLSIEDTVSLLEKNNILQTNPNPEKISILKLNEIRQRPGESAAIETFEDRFYSPVQNLSGESRKLEDFRFIDRQVTIQIVKDRVGIHDRAFNKETRFIHYKIDEPNINLVSLEFTNRNPDSKILSAKILYNNREEKDLFEYFNKK